MVITVYPGPAHSGSAVHTYCPELSPGCSGTLCGAPGVCLTQATDHFFITRYPGAETEAPILWPPDAKSRLIGKDPDAGKDLSVGVEGGNRG